MRVVVVGGGVAGLFTASELVAQGVDDVVVVDSADDPGGVTRTIRRDGFSLEPAAGSFNLPHPHLSPILERAGVMVEEARDASIRHVYVGARLVTLQPSPQAILAPVAPVTAKLRALAEPLVPVRDTESDESLGSFCRRRFGRRAGDLLGSLMAAGVFAGDPERLSVTAAFPLLSALEREHGSVIRGALRRRRDRPADAPRPRMHLPAGGMAEMSRRIASSLGGRFRGGLTVETLRRDDDGWVLEGSDGQVADAVVLAVRPDAAAGLVGGGLSDTLGSVISSEVAVVGLGGEGVSPLPEGFGALIAPDEGMASVGALFESSYAPSRAPEGAWLMKVIVGGARSPEVAALRDDDLVGSVIDEMGVLLGTQLSTSFVEVIRHRPGIPQYVTGHERWLADLDALLAKSPGLYLAGWGYRGVGVAALATDAARLAGEIVRRQGA